MLIISTNGWYTTRASLSVPRNAQVLFLQWSVNMHCSHLIFWFLWLLPFHIQDMCWELILKHPLRFPCFSSVRDPSCIPVIVIRYLISLWFWSLPSLCPLSWQLFLKENSISKRCTMYCTSHGFPVVECTD